MANPTGPLRPRADLLLLLAGELDDLRRSAAGCWSRRGDAVILAGNDSNESNTTA
jgi:hypothetical protein